MVAFNAEDLRTFTAELFTRDTFDEMLVREAEFTTYCSFSIDGRVNGEWYSDEELEEDRVEDYASWQTLRPVCFGLIRGKKTPSAFKIVFRLAPEQTEKFMKEETPGIAGTELGGLFLNIRFEKGKLVCVSMASLNSFHTDHTVEHAWDSRVERFFSEHGIAVSRE